MPSHAGRRVILVAAAAFAAPAGAFLLLVAYLMSPAIDQCLGIGTSAALRLVQRHREGGETVLEAVNRRYAQANWSSFHRDYLEETYVRCDARDVSKRKVSMVWVVTAVPEWRRVFPSLHVEATAHNVAAFQIAPTLYTRGHPLYDSPDFANW